MPTKHNHDKNGTSCPNTRCFLHDPEMFKKYFEARYGKKQDFCRIHVPGEGLWGIRLAPGVAIVNNVPLSDKISLHDIVQIDSSGEFIKNLQRMSWGFGIKYPVPTNDADQSKVKAYYKSLATKLRENQLDPEGACIGMAMVSAPLGMTKAQARKIIKTINKELNTTVEPYLD